MSSRLHLAAMVVYETNLATNMGQMPAKSYIHWVHKMYLR